MTKSALTLTFVVICSTAFPGDGLASGLNLVGTVESGCPQALPPFLDAIFSRLFAGWTRSLNMNGYLLRQTRLSTTPRALPCLPSDLVGH